MTVRRQVEPKPPAVSNTIPSAKALKGIRLLQIGSLLEPGVGVEPTLAIRCGMFTTGCYELCLQPVALSDRPSVDIPTPAWFGPRQKEAPGCHSYKLDEARLQKDRSHLDHVSQLDQMQCSASLNPQFYRPGSGFFETNNRTSRRTHAACPE